MEETTMRQLTAQRRLLGGAAIVLVTLGIAASAPSASAATPHAGAIDVYEVGTLSATDHSIVITGAFADSGSYAPPSSNGSIELHLSKGTIKVDDSRGAAAESKAYEHLAKFLNASNCGLALSYSASATLISGTGAYAGITGKVTTTTHDAGLFPMTEKGACNTNANPVGYLDIGMGSGSVSFKQSQ
jgi:hypothetical protein